MNTELTGKTYVVTGATSGIGLAVAEALVRQGAMIIGTGRSEERCRAAEKGFQISGLAGKAVYLTGDLALQSEVRSLAAQTGTVLAEAGRDHLDGLVNNAGTFTYWMALTAEGFETQWAVNHLAPFLLTHELLPWLRAAPEARVVTVSSATHYSARLNWEDIQLRRRYNGLRAYGQTKLANVLFTLELNQRFGAGSTIRAYAADPGLVNTQIGKKGTPAIVRWFWGLRASGGVSPEKAAAGILCLLTDPLAKEAQSVYWKNGAPKQPSRYALDREAARRLWNLSAQMCGIDPETGQEL